MPTTRIFVIDSKLSSSLLLRKMLSGYDHLEIVGCLADYPEALSEIPQLNPDIVIVNVDIQCAGIAHILLQIRSSHPELPVLMLCNRKNNKHAAKVLEALAAGANDYIPKTEYPPTEPGAIQQFCVDVLFRSVVKCYGRNVLAVLLTGMGKNGLEGCRAIHPSGGTVFAQDEESSVVWGMPGAIVRAGITGKILSNRIMASEIIKRVSEGRTVSPSTPNLQSQKLFSNKQAASFTRD